MTLLRWRWTLFNQLSAANFNGICYLKALESEKLYFSELSVLSFSFPVWRCYWGLLESIWVTDAESQSSWPQKMASPTGDWNPGYRREREGHLVTF